MSDFDPVPHFEVFPAVEEAPAEVVEAEPVATEPPVVEAEKTPELRTTPEGVILSKVTVSAEGVILKVED